MDILRKAPWMELIAVAALILSIINLLVLWKRGREQKRIDAQLVLNELKSLIAVALTRVDGVVVDLFLLVSKVKGGDKKLVDDAILLTEELRKNLRSFDNGMDIEVPNRPDPTFIQRLLVTKGQVGEMTQHLEGLYETVRTVRDNYDPD